MGIPVLILGESGSGKSTSLRNFEEGQIGIFNVASKPLPFRKKLPKVDGATYQVIERSLSNPKLKTYVIDDSQYLLVNEFFDRAKEAGYQKYTDMALNFRNLVHAVNHNLPDDVIVYFLHHTETDSNGREKAKTIGRMLDEKLVLEGSFDVVLYCEDQKFYTQANGQSTAKSPEGMFQAVEIPNDLKAVDAAIRDYWGI